MQQILNSAIEIVKQAADIIKNNINRGNYNINKKGTNDFVTDIDKQTEAFLVKQLSAIMPSAGFITEENTVNKIANDYNWIIDPIDGTSNFIHGIFPCSISLALKKGDDIIIGIVYEVGREECFYALKNHGAFLNGNRISVSKTASIANAFVATGFPYNNFAQIEPYLRLFNHLVVNTQGMRRLGSAAVDLAYVACGRFDAFYEIDLKPYDVAAGIILVEEAGGCVCDFKTTNNFLFGGEIVATNKLLSDDFAKLVNSYMQ